MFFCFFIVKLYFTVVYADNRVWVAAGEDMRISFLWRYTGPGERIGCIPS